ncbi:uncharacterized protein LOC120510232 [Passer montanus]|uniref:uncharacterized protein LOC120510232 n=1 Tax=Passer montanus TaxID=9160 RepID=UPI00195FD520|nr:uncharacterized protein LOC120510232 [Passer montanus]
MSRSRRRARPFLPPTGGGLPRCRGGTSPGQSRRRWAGWAERRGDTAGAARGAGSLRVGVPGPVPPARERSGCATRSPRSRRGRTRLPSAVPAAGTARRAGLNAGGWWAKPAPPRRQSRCSSAAERGARRGGGGKRRRRVAAATGGAAEARTGAEPVCSGKGLEADLGQRELHRRRGRLLATSRELRARCAPLAALAEHAGSPARPCHGISGINGISSCRPPGWSGSQSMFLLL